MSVRTQKAVHIDLLLLFVALIWGTSYALTKQSLVLMPIFLFIALRFALTFMLLTPFVWTELKNAWGQRLGQSALLGCLLFGIFTFEVHGVFHTSASNAAVLISLCIVFTPIIERIMLGTHWSKALNWAIPISLLGIALLTFKGTFLSTITIGDGFILIAAVLRACMVVGTKKHIVKNALSPIALTAVQSATVAICAVVASLVVNESWHLPMQWSFWATLLYLVVFCTLIAFLATNFSLKYVSASRASFLMGTEPLFGLMFAILMLNEYPNMMNTLGAVLIVGATYGVLYSADGKTSANTNRSRSTTSPS
jgi:drug/metabolite transporter (DMT)-like permease